jgi:hypothetical protein
MGHRSLTSLSIAAVVTTGMLLPVASMAGQSQAAAPRPAAPAPKAAAPAKPYTVPRTPWGDPDLQGVYNYATSTPMQRPRNAADKKVLSDEEAVDLQEELAEALNRDRRDGGAEADANRAYNDFWMDPLRMKLTQDKRTSLIIDPPDGRLPARVPLSPERQKEQQVAAEMNARFNNGFMESYTDGDVGNRCIIRRRNEGGGHPYLPSIYNNVAQILQVPGYVVIYAEMIHFSRIIPIDGRPHLPSNVKTWLGDPRGHWEGDTLVVETTNFRSDDSMGRPLGRTGVVWGGADAETYTITERFTRIGANQIDYTVTMADPHTWTRPITMLIPFNKTNYEIYEYGCQETNYDMYHWLSGARAREAKGETFDVAAATRRGGGADGGGEQEER